MFATFHPLLLEALADGIVLLDRGSFAVMRATFRDWLASGAVTRLPSGWKLGA